jgi:hypothetical protein
MFELSSGLLKKMTQIIKLIGEKEEPVEEFRTRATLIVKKDNYLLDRMWQCDILNVSGDNYKLNTDLLQIIDSGWRAVGREILWYYIESYSPLWSKSLHSGFQVFKKKIDHESNTKQLFRSLGLLPEIDEISPDVNEWWLRASSWSRNLSHEKEQEAKKIIGDKGELLSKNYEESRTKKSPKWVSKDSDNYGYDIESIAEEDNEEAVFIEVKATSKLKKNAAFYVSRNEGDKCSKFGEKYFFHFWILAEENANLLIIKGEDVMAHFPENRGDGLWEKVKIPFEVFDWSDSIIVGY